MTESEQIAQIESDKVLIFKLRSDLERAKRQIVEERKHSKGLQEVNEKLIATLAHQTVKIKELKEMGKQIRASLVRRQARPRLQPQPQQQQMGSGFKFLATLFMLDSLFKK